MKFPDPDTVRSALESAGNDVHFVHVTKDRKIVIARTTKGAFSDAVVPLPMLLVHMCVTGGGPLRHSSTFVHIEEDISAGAIGVIPPGSKGEGHWPQMTAITIAISVDVVIESFGEAWAGKLKSKLMSQIFRDPLVEATMLDVGYTRAGSISDVGLHYAALMIVHQLLDHPMEKSDADRGVIPLSAATLDRINALLDANIDRHVSVSEMAETAGISRHHFSRRFKAATGHSPLQFFIRRKLDYAAALLEQSEGIDVTTVAQDVGFANTSYFTRAFRQHFGLSPRVWKTEQMRAADSSRR
ncbi:MAG: AraC family transcriptional regulator [Pseudomonadota bacterium]